MRRKAEKILKATPQVIGAAMMKETEIEVKECQRSAPVNKGEMRDGIHAAGPFFEGRTIKTLITTSEVSREYDLIQHEDLELFHDQGDAKFIERPLKESAPHFAERIAARIDLGKAV